MQIVTHEQLLPLLAASRRQLALDSPKITTGLTALDEIAPNGGFATGAMHEVLSDSAFTPTAFPILIARSIKKKGWIVWCDLHQTLYPPALAAMGISLDRLLVLHPANQKEGLWAAIECLRCKGVDAWMGSFTNLNFLQARRLQLAAEKGGGIGILLRTASERNCPYAAATRWLARPAPGEKRVQRQLIELIHGHGGQVGEMILLEVCRETHHVRATKAVAHRATDTQRQTAIA